MKQWNSKPSIPPVTLSSVSIAFVPEPMTDYGSASTAQTFPPFSLSILC